MSNDTLEKRSAPCGTKSCPLRRSCGRGYTPPRIGERIPWMYYHPVRDADGDFKCAHWVRKDTPKSKVLKEYPGARVWIGQAKYIGCLNPEHPDTSLGHFYASSAPGCWRRMLEYIEMPGDVKHSRRSGVGMFENLLDPNWVKDRADDS